jgi:hypothetical protein
MSLFPDIAKYGFSQIQFKSHVPGGFEAIRKYLMKMGKEAKGKDIWLYKFYSRNKKPHTAVLSFAKREKGCADIIIGLEAKQNSELGALKSKDHLMTSKDFINIFKFLNRRGPKWRPLNIAFIFRRIFSGPIFPKDESKPISLRGIKFAGKENSPMDFIYIDEMVSGKVVIKVYSKPVFSFDKRYFNKEFFVGPLKSIVRLSDVLYHGFREEVYDKSSKRMVRT